MTKHTPKKPAEDQVSKVRALLARAESKLAAGEFMPAEYSHVSGGRWARDNVWERQRNSCIGWLRHYGLEAAQ